MPEYLQFLSDLSELQLALILIGAGILLGIIFYNFFKSKTNSSNSFSTKDNIKVQPSFKNNQNEFDSSSRVEPGFSRTSEDQNQSVETETVASVNSSFLVNIPRIDPAIDCSVVLHFSVPIGGAEVMSHFLGWPKNSPFRHLVEGLRSVADNHQINEWEPITAENSYTELQVAIQLANRRGPIGVVDLSEFLTRCQSLADSLDAEIDLPPVNQVLEQAKNLDEFCVSSDIQLGFILAANMISWSASDVQNVLQKRGLILSRDGAFFNSYDRDQLNFRAQADGINFLLDDLQGKRIKQIQFLLDVPISPINSDPFMSMLEIANQLAGDLDGRLLDDNGQALVEASIQGIQTYLNNLYQLMRSRDIVPGSQTAIRLYS